MMHNKKSVTIFFALIASLPLLVESSLRTRGLTTCDTLKACYLINIQTRKETGLDGSDTFALDPLNRDGYSIRCDVNGDATLDFIKFFYNGVVQDEFGLPRYMNGDSDAGSYINKVDYLSTCGKKTLRIEGHVWSNLCFEKVYNIEVTSSDGKTCDGDVPTNAPVKPPTNAPVKPPTKAPTRAPVRPPVKPPTNAPVKPPTKAPTRAPVRPPVKPPTDAPVKPPTKAPTRAPVRPPVKPPTNAPVKPPTKSPTRAPVRPPVKPPTNAPVKPPTKSPTRAPVRPPVKPPTDAPVRPPVKPPTPVCPYPQEWINGCCRDTCRNDYVCPANSCRIPNHLCYDSFEDCQCNSGYVKSPNEDKCIRQWY